MSRAVILARVSDPKQKIKGDSLDDQLIKCNSFVKNQGWIKDREFTLIESGRKGERSYFWEVYDYCKSKQNTPEKIDYLVVLNLGRFTRSGGNDYLNLKKKFEIIGVQITDIFKTVGQKVNTLEDLGVSYDWSEFSPTEAAEVYEANQRRDYVRDQLTQMIGGCIRNIRKGYWNGPAPYGLANKKIETVSDGIRNILTENPSESVFIKKMFQMRADGYPDTEITKELNVLGFKTRLLVRRDKRTKVKIGTRGGIEMTPKKVQELIINPIYCGVIVAQWTNHQPVKATNFEGIVDISTFNRAARGKVFVIKNSDGTFQVKYNIKIGKIGNGDKRLRDNPKYPFKSVIRCPICGKELKASGSRGRSGEKFHYYFCDRGHPRWHKKIGIVEETVSNYVEKLKYSEGFTKLFNESFTEVWKEKRVEAVNDSEIAERNVAEIACKQKNVLETIQGATTELVRKALEGEYVRLESELQKARDDRNNKESEELNVKEVLDYVDYLMEHPKELLIDRDNMLNQRQMFGLVFEELPTYENLVNGTAKLQPIYQKIGEANVEKSDLVQQVGVEPTLDSFTDCCLTVRLLLE